MAMKFQSLLGKIIGENGNFKNLNALFQSLLGKIIASA